MSTSVCACVTILVCAYKYVYVNLYICICSVLYASVFVYVNAYLLRELRYMCTFLLPPFLFELPSAHFSGELM